MPQWRKLHLKAVESLDINDMPDDFTRLMWVLLPLGLDSEGRGLDNPAWVKSRIFPIRTDVTLEMIERAMAWYWHRCMIIRYEVGGRRYFYLPTFHKYQGKTDREARSEYPEPLQDEVTEAPVINEEPVRTYSGPTQELVLSKSSSDVDSDTDSIPNGISGVPPLKPEKQLKTKTPQPERPEEPGPKSQLMGCFQAETKLALPRKETEVKFWWSTIQEIYDLAERNADTGKDFIHKAVEHMRREKLTITSPHSILGMVRILASGQVLVNHKGGNGSGPAPQRDPITEAERKRLEELHGRIAYADTG